MKHLKKHTLRLGALYAALLLLLDFTNIHTLFADHTWTLVHDLTLLISFIVLSILGINVLRKESKSYSFAAGYLEALGIGIVGVGLYFLLSLLINCFYIESGESFSKLFAAVLPNLLTQVGINFFLLLFFSLLPPTYFLIMGKGKIINPSRSLRP